jgi:hypothetical protein
VAFAWLSNWIMKSPGQVVTADRAGSMSRPAPGFSSEDEDHVPDAGKGAAASDRRLLRRPTTAETERIAREFPPERLTIPLLVSGHDLGRAVLPRQFHSVPSLGPPFS